MLLLLAIKQTAIWAFSLYYYIGSSFIESIPMVLSIAGLLMFYFLTTFCEHLKDLSLTKSKNKAQSMHRNILGVVEAISDSILVISKNKNLIFANTEGKNMIKGVSAESFFSTVIYYRRYVNNKDFTGNVFNDIIELFSCKIDTEQILGIVTINDKLVEWKVKLIIWDNRPSVILCGHDVSYLVKMEKESNENQYKSALLRTVSHELRTPVCAIISISEAISSSQQLSLENMDRLDIINTSSNFQLCLINDLLDYAQILSRCLKISKSYFNIHHLLLECLKIIKLQLRERDVQLELVAKNIPELIFSDPYRLKQVLLNLLSNAKKFTIKGKITLEAFGDNDTITVICQDTGIGIPKEKHKNIFTPFSKLEYPNTINPQGVGLGLVISNMLIQELGGVGIIFTSEVDKGSKFSFNIPINTITGNNNLDIAEENIQIIVPSIYTKTILHKFEILIVDDNYFNILALIKMIETEGILYEFAMNGLEALEKIKCCRFSCIIMDCEMPIMNGWETCKKIREMYEENEIKLYPKIIGCTAHSADEALKKCWDCGMIDVIVKPCTKDTLLGKLRCLWGVSVDDKNYEIR
ncbi:hypothetical protein SteCoe_35160 [Stentor coeruleus]|uniref:Histidine kinase n=1 Tax=Stentor coeruleus TaxID=5963 RepID=A0A1R2AT34_9CILI|nr:hypothetical protein SteCoe_35160 [Stentor coeruleus]